MSCVGPQNWSAFWTSFVVFVVVGASCRSSYAKIIGAAVIPHGDFALDPSLVGYKNGSLELHVASLAVGKWIVDLSPDFVMMTTPHGVSARKAFSFFMNDAGSGSCDLGADLYDPTFQNYRVHISVPLVGSSVIEPILSRLETQGLNASGITAYTESEPFPLRWGEVIPLWFLSDIPAKMKHRSDSLPSKEQPRIVAGHVDIPQMILSIPTRRNLDSEIMVPELLEFGSRLYEQLEALEERVVVLISSDLAHTHLASGPYGFNETAAPFDEAIGRWGASLSLDPLMEAAGVVNRAQSCGFTGMVMLHGLLTASGGTQKWVPSVEAIYHPTYYGMMVATFTLKAESATN